MIALLFWYWVFSLFIIASIITVDFYLKIKLERERIKMKDILMVRNNKKYINMKIISGFLEEAGDQVKTYDKDSIFSYSRAFSAKGDITFTEFMEDFFSVWLALLFAPILIIVGIWKLFWIFLKDKYGNEIDRRNARYDSDQLWGWFLKKREALIEISKIIDKHNEEIRKQAAIIQDIANARRNLGKIKEFNNETLGCI